MELERAFADWLDRRDAAALARVFDGTAGRLLLLAVHFAGPGTEAEDLVQATFLQAMQCGRTWDRTRPLWPWLAAILHNEARMAWRRRQRRREVGIESADAAAAREPDPAERALHGDAFDAAVAAIDALPLPYRQVLRLRLQHGLSPVEIARALEVPVGTVRSQLHRGLEQLRGALPAGLAVAVAACLAGEGPLLAQVRAQVLTQAKATTAAATGVAAALSLLWSAGWWSMKGKLIAGATLAALFVGASALLLGGLGGPAAPTPSPAPVVASVPAAVADRGGERAPQQRTLADAAATPEWPLVATVKCGGAPLAGVDVAVWVATRGGQLGQRQGECLREDIAHGVTAADGTFRCSLAAMRSRTELFHASRYVYVAARQAGCGDVSRILDLPATTAPHAFTAELTLRARGGVVGRVVDAAGAPAAAAQVRAIRDGRLGFYSAETTASDGSFAVPARSSDDWPERLVVVAPSLGMTVVEVTAATAPREPGRVVDVGDVMLVPRDAIRGRVVLGDGLPLGEHPIWLIAIDEELARAGGSIAKFFSTPDGNNREPLELQESGAVQVAAESVTAADGSFVFAGLDAARPYAVAVRDAAIQFVWVAARAGDVGVELQVARQLVRLDVRDEAGTVISGIRLRADGSVGGRPIVGNAFFAGDAAGRYMWLSPFGWSWTFAAADRAARPGTLTHEVAAGVHRADLSLVLEPEGPPGAVHFTVVDENGAALSNYGVRLHCFDRPLAENCTRIVPPPGGLRLDLPAGRWHAEVWLGKEVIYEDLLEMYARGRHDEDVVVASGATTELRVVAPPAGMVAFQLDSDVLPTEGVWPDLKIVDQATGTDVAVLAHRDYEPGRPRLDRPWAPMVDALLIARQAFAPGPRAFVVSARGYRSERCDVDVAADALTHCRLRLIRQP